MNSIFTKTFKNEKKYGIKTFFPSTCISKIFVKNFLELLLKEEEEDEEECGTIVYAVSHYIKARLFTRRLLILKTHIIKPSLIMTE